MGTEVSRHAHKHSVHPNISHISATVSSSTCFSFDSDDFDTASTSKSSPSKGIRYFSKYIRLPASKRPHQSIVNDEEPATHKSEICERDGDRRPKPRYERSRKQFTLMHELFDEFLHGRKFKSPVHSILEAGGRVLDIGCGTGCWSYSMASLYPRSKIYGLDLTDELLNLNPSPTPSNFTFTLHDMHSGLPYTSGAFDLVFSSTMVWSSTREQLPALLSEFQRVTKPGGYIEMLEGDFKCFGSETCPTYEKLYNRITTAMRTRANVDPVLPTRLTNLLGSQPGLVFVTGNQVRVPMGWNDGLGISCRTVFGSLINSLMRKLLDDMRDEAEDALAEALNELAENNSYVNIYYAYAQKSMFC